MPRYATLAGAALIAVSTLTTPPVQARFENDPSLLIPPKTGDAAAPAAEEAGEATADAAAPAAEEGAAPAAVATGIDGLIASHAAAHGVPVALARAVVTVESNFNPGVTGRAGEIGLMQIKPATARGIGYAGGTKALYDPDTNLRWGMKYLAGAYNRAGGDLCGTIMRYQGGHYARRMTKANSVYCSRVKRIMGSA